PASAKEKFSRLSNAPVLTQASALSEYPVGGWHWYNGSPIRPTHCTSGIGVSTSVPSALTEDTTSSYGVLIFARYASLDQNSGESIIVRITSLMSPLLFWKVFVIRATSASGGVSDTNRRASFAEMNFAVFGFFTSRSINCSPSFIPPAWIFFPNTTFGSGSRSFSSNLNVATSRGFSIVQHVKHRATSVTSCCV